MPLDERDKLQLAELYRHPGMEVLRRLLKDFRKDYAVALGLHLCAEPDSFVEAEHKAQVQGFRIANRLLNQAAKQAGTHFAPDDESENG